MLRDAEVKRLAAASAEGPDVDRLAQQYRNDANEAVILQLNQQVGLPRCKCMNQLSAVMCWGAWKMVQLQ